ncbi:MAG: GTP cyclohydrolase I FolE [Legionellales bacterium]|nr:GTP cyclohydrolase I FolE [Legionellales bacterium]
MSKNNITPISDIKNDNDIEEQLAKNYRNILLNLGEDIYRVGLQKTPDRAAKSMQFLTQGYQHDLNSIVNGALFDSDIDELVIVKDIELYSLCEHHLLPFIGKCHVGYIPNGKILGLSKISRIVDMFSRRLQIQENLTKQIANAMEKITGAKGVGVILEANHLCMMMRGVQKQNSTMSTSVMLGLLRKDEKTRAEFINLVNKN